MLLLVGGVCWGLVGCWGGDFVEVTVFSVVKLNACDDGEAVDEGAERFLLFLVFGGFSVPSWDLGGLRD